MAIQIGNKLENDFNNPIGLLCDCHRRIERFLNLLIVVTEQAQGRELNDDQRQALDTALRYFQKSAPRHTLDEEESLFPRLRKVGRELKAETLATVDLLHTEHLQIDTAHNEINALIFKWIEEGTLTEVETADLQDALMQLHTTYQQHITYEEETLFPLAQEILKDEELRVIGEEMAQRRGINFEVWKTSI